MNSNEEVDLNSYIGRQIRKFRKEKGWTPEQLANKLGTSRVTINRYETGARKANQDSLFELAQLFKKSINDFFPPTNEEKTIPPASNMEFLYNSNTAVYRIPIIGEIACGDPITAEENIDGYITETFENDKPSGTLFALKAKGHSMEPTIPSGATVIIREQPTVEDGEIAAVLVDGDTNATLKRIKHVNGIVMLQPDNRDYDPILLTKDNPGRIIGKAIEVTTKL